jgi:secretion/DNA translocation related TadE-like protein
VNRRRDEEGVAVVLALGLVVLLTVVAVVGVGVVALVATHRQVQAAADLAALAGAQAATAGEDPCAAAARIARDNRAHLEECRREGEVVAVVLTSGPLAWAGDSALRGRARAGPSDPSR